MATAEALGKFCDISESVRQACAVSGVNGLALTKLDLRETPVSDLSPLRAKVLGGSLRDIVKKTMPQALALGLERLREWGAEPQQRPQPLPEDATLTGAMLTLERYEAERPSVEQACRIGDERFIPKEF